MPTMLLFERNNPCLMSRRSRLPTSKGFGSVMSLRSLGRGNGPSSPHRSGVRSNVAINLSLGAPSY
jgi:hypothetical protein